MKGDEEQVGEGTRATSRRAVVVGAAGGGVLLASGCGGGDEPATGTGGEVRVPTADVPEGGGVVVGRVVVTQPSAGSYRAFDATCPHQGCAVGDVTSEAIVCPCHGSTFDPESGAVTAGPATSGLTARTATVDGADVVVG